MSFTASQLRALRRPPPQKHVRTRQANGRELSYIEGWYAVSEANRIFGFGSWDRETLETKCVLARELRGTFHAVYVCRVRITVRAESDTVFREGHGTGEGKGPSPAEAHELALKGAETDATKRALATFGRPFGLALHGHKPLRSDQPASRSLIEPPPNFVSLPNGSVPPPREVIRPRRTIPQDGAALIRQFEQQASSPEQRCAAELSDPIDKSALTFGEPPRRRNKEHLRMVANRPCLVCGRAPSDPHHLRFAQARALGAKVSDEFAVPLCRIHHREAHHHGDERAWWSKYGIDPLPIAERLWKTRTEGPVEIDAAAPLASASH